MRRFFRRQPSATRGSDRPAAVADSYTRILVPVTDSDVSARAVITAAMLASERKAAITLLSVLEVPKGLPIDALFPEEEHQGRETLRRATAILDQYGIGSHGRLVRSAAAATAIIEAANDTHPEIIVMGAERRLHRHLRIFGDNVQAVLKAAPCRVMLVSPWPGRQSPDETPAAERGTGQPALSGNASAP